jgi:hypothetical protein
MPDIACQCLPPVNQGPKGTNTSAFPFITSNNINGCVHKSVCFLFMRNFPLPIRAGKSTLQGVSQTSPLHVFVFLQRFKDMFEVKYKSNVYTIIDMIL